MVDPREKALSLLKNRDKTEYEIRVALEKLNVPPDKIDETIEYLKDMGYVNDSSYAYRFVEVSMSKIRGPGRIRRDLEQKGVATETIAEALDETMEDEWEWEAADAILEGIKKKNGSLSEDKILAKLINKLNYEGFSEEVINEIAEGFFIDED